MFSGLHYDITFSAKDKEWSLGFSSIKLQCFYWKPGYDDFWVKLHYLQANDIQINSVKMSDPLSKTSLISENIFNLSKIQFFYVNNDRNIIYLKLTSLLLTVNRLEILMKCANCQTNNGRESFIRLWSEKTSWTTNKLPEKDEKITIPYKYRILLDMNPPKLDQLVLDGVLIFDEMWETSNFQFNVLWIRQGQLLIGTKQKPFPFPVKISVVGDKSSTYLQVDENYKTQKAILLNGEIYMNGIARKITSTKLLDLAIPGNNTLSIIQECDWKVGDVILLGSSGFAHENEVLNYIYFINSSLILIFYYRFLP